MNSPKHVGIIPDGNRRLARRLIKSPWKGHEWGLGKLKEVLEWCNGLGIKIVTFYTLSLENLEKRPKREIKYLFSLAKKEIKNILDDEDHVVHRNNARVSFFGKIDLLPPDLQKGIEEVSDMTKDYSDFYLNLAIAYGGRQEIVDASRRMAADAAKGTVSPAKISESLLRQYFWTNGFRDPDLIIRTGGEKRLSNFLLFQSSYSELIFLDKFWPELEREDFADAVKEFRSRKRRFGQ